jgi:dephospho-CoA kinase
MRLTSALLTLFAYRSTASFEIPASSSRTVSSSTPSWLPMTSSLLTEFKVLGVCGGIGSGKSTAAKLLVSDCACLVHLDADSLAHSVYSPGSQAVQDIAAEFGSGVLVEKEEGTLEIDRKKLGAVVFADRKDMAVSRIIRSATSSSPVVVLRRSFLWGFDFLDLTLANYIIPQKLERLVWPHVKSILMDRIAQVKSEWEKASSTKASNPVVVLEAAVLLDAEWDDILDGIWVVKAPRDVALKRLMETRNLSEEESKKRIDAQESRRGIHNLQEEIDKGVVTRVIDNSKSLDELKRSLHEALLNPKSWKETL